MNTKYIRYLFMMIALLALFFSTTGCDRHTNHAHRNHHPAGAEAVQTVEVYKTPANNNSGNDWLFWYLMFNNQSHSYYYYSSPAPIAESSYSRIPWTRSDTKPPALTEPEDTTPPTLNPDTVAVEPTIQPIETQQVPDSQLGAAGAEIESSYGVPEENSLDSMEGVPEGNDPSTSESTGESSSSSGDSGGSSSSGGDSGGGGGDGGGGGGGGGE